MRKPVFTPLLQRLLDEPDDYLNRIRADSDRFARDVLEAGDAELPLGAIPSLASLANVVFSAQGTVVYRSVADDWPADLRFEDLLDQLPMAGEAPRILFLHWPGGPGLRAVCIPSARALDLNLPYSIRESLSKNPGSRLLMGTNALVGSRALEAAGRSFGLTGQQQRAASAVARTESGRAAAEALGLSYETVREALSLATRKVGAPNLPALIRRLTESAFGILPHTGSDPADPVALADWLPLTARQAQVCELVTSGLSREAVAATIGVSLALIKKELDLVFQVLRVGSAAGLARVWVEVQALKSFAQATDGPLGFFDPSVEPTRFLPRVDDRQIIAWSDYGPASGRPVLVIHSNWTCRAVPQAMVLRLQAAGWRPIAIDRPGFGMTHPGSLSLETAFEQAVSDTIAVLDRLKIDRIAVLARRAGQFTTVLKQCLGDRIGPILLTSPAAPTTDKGRRTGIVGVIKEAFYRSPRLVEFYFRAVTPQLSLERMDKLTREICRGSPPDEALSRDPQFIRDRFRAIRPFSTGNLTGAVIEEILVSRNLVALEPLTGSDMMIAHGLHDNHYSLEEVTDYWSGKWPSAEIRCFDDGGQFLTSSHPALLVALLEELASRSAA